MESLTLEQASYLAEIIGVVTVVGSIIYLAIQVKQSTQAMRSETSNVITNNAMDQYQLFATHADLFEIMQKGMSDPESLADIERGRMNAYVFGTLISWQNFYYHWQKNELDYVAWTPWEKLFTDALSLPGFQSVWELRSKYLQKDFREYCEKLMSEPVSPHYKFMGVGQSG